MMNGSSIKQGGVNYRGQIFNGTFSDIRFTQSSAVVQSSAALERREKAKDDNRVDEALATDFMTAPTIDFDRIIASFCRIDYRERQISESVQHIKEFCSTINNWQDQEISQLRTYKASDKKVTNHQAQDTQELKEDILAFFSEVQGYWGQDILKFKESMLAFDKELDDLDPEILKSIQHILVAQKDATFPVTQAQKYYTITSLHIRIKNQNQEISQLVKDMEAFCDRIKNRYLEMFRLREGIVVLLSNNVNIKNNLPIFPINENTRESLIIKLLRNKDKRDSSEPDKQEESYESGLHIKTSIFSNKRSGDEVSKGSAEKRKRSEPRTIEYLQIQKTLQPSTSVADVSIFDPCSSQRNK